MADKPTSDSRIDIFRGRLAMMEQRYEDAERLLSEVLLYAPSNAEGNAWMAAVKMCQREPEEAVRLAERAYRLGYHRAWLLELSGSRALRGRPLRASGSGLDGGTCART